MLIWEDFALLKQTQQPPSPKSAASQVALSDRPKRHRHHSWVQAKHTLPQLAANEINSAGEVSLKVFCLHFPYAVLVSIQTAWHFLNHVPQRDYRYTKCKGSVSWREEEVVVFVVNIWAATWVDESSPEHHVPQDASILKKRKKRKSLNNNRGRWVLDSLVPTTHLWRTALKAWPHILADSSSSGKP